MNKFKFLCVFGISLSVLFSIVFVGNLIYKEFEMSDSQIVCGNQKYVLFREFETRVPTIYNLNNKAMFWKFGTIDKSIYNRYHGFKTFISIIKNQNDPEKIDIDRVTTFIPENDTVTKNDIENLRKCYTNHTFKVIGTDGLFQSEPQNWVTPESIYEK